MKLRILGSNSAMPASGRFPTCAALEFGKEIFLLDCGEGAQIRMDHFGVRRGKIHHIFITHLHGDHVFGLPGLITSYSLNQRTAPLHLYGPEGLETLIRVQLEITRSHLNFPLHFYVTNPEQSEILLENERLRISTLPLKHRVPANGYLFQEKTPFRRLLPDKLEAFGIPHKGRLALKLGADYHDPVRGVTIPNEAFTEAAPLPHSVAFCTDTMYHEPLIPLIRGVNLLYHEATFTEDRRAWAEQTMHSTAGDAARIALAAGVKKLVIGHLSTRYATFEPLLEEARAVFPETFAAEEGREFETAN